MVRPSLVTVVVLPMRHVASRSTPKSVSLPVPPMRVLMFWKSPLNAASRMLKPSVPTPFKVMTRDVLKLAKVSVSFALLPMTVSIAETASVLVLM